VTTATVDPDDEDGPGADIVPLRPRDQEPLDAEVVEQHAEPAPTGREVEPAPSRARALVQRWDRPLPDRAQLAARARWYGRHGGVAARNWLLHLPLLALRELRPIGRGIGRIASGWARWANATEWATAAKAAEGNERAKAAQRLEAARSGRRRVSLAAALLLAAGACWAYVAAPALLVVAVLALVVVCDAVGRRGVEGAPRITVLPAGPITEGTPLSTLRAQIETTLVGLGVPEDDIAVEQPTPVTGGWTARYWCRHALTDDHLRGVERDLQFRRGAVSIVVDRGNAARGVMSVMPDDPLDRVVESPEPDALTIYRPLPLGVTAGGQEWSEQFLRTHFAAIGASQSGKSSWMWQATDALRRCPEVELDAIDLTEGPAFGATRRAFRRRAFDEDSARRVLTEAVALCKQRNAELQRRAEDDDTPDDFEEKHQPTVDDPQRVVMIDEFARLAEDEELLKLVEYLLRYGAKAAVVVGIAGQGATLADFGTSTVRAQVMLKILFACSRRDVLDLLGKDARDAGYRPDLFEAAAGGAINDAGKCFVMSATSRTPEPRRAYRLEQAEVRRRDRALGRRDTSAGAVDAVEVPPALAVLERLAAGREHVPTAEVLAELGDGWTAKRLATALAEHGVAPVQYRPDPDDPDRKVRGYRAGDVARAIRSL
jgi:hypothetical protein